MPKRYRSPITAWSIVGLFAFYAAADCFLTYRGLPSPFPVHLVAKIAEDKTLDPWHQRNKTLFPGLVIVAVVGAFAHHLGFRCAVNHSDKKRRQRLTLPFGISHLMPPADHQWLYWGFVTLFHIIPLLTTIYLATEFFNHPNLYYRDGDAHQVWVTFFSPETWNFTGLFHRRPILWSNDIEMQRGIWPLLLILFLTAHAYIFSKFSCALLRKPLQTV
jgi:hypothetical protein